MSDRERGKHAEGETWSAYVEESDDEHSDTAVLTLRGIEIAFDQAAIDFAGEGETVFYFRDVSPVSVPDDRLPDDAAAWIESVLRDGRTVEQLDA